MAFWSCSGESGSTAENKSNQLIPAVEAVQARTGALPLTERLTGVVRAVNQVAIYPEVSAVIQQVFVQNGAVVNNRQPLIQLRNKEFQERLNQARASYQIAVAQAKQAEARLKEVNSELQRVKSLAEKELVSETELEMVQTRTISAEADLELANARVEQAKAVMDEREESLSQTMIRAPISGTVGNRNAEVGMLVSNSTRLFTIGQLDSVRVEVVLTDRMLQYIEKGQRTEIFAEGSGGGPLSAPLARISPFLHPVTHSTEAEIDLSNRSRELKPGMFVTVDVFYGESEEATLVPLSALYENPSTGTVGVYISRETLNREPVGAVNPDQPVNLTDPVPFEFKEVEVVAKGCMEAGVRDIEPGNWVVTLGQELLGAGSGVARVRPVKWNWVEQLQKLQRQDLLEEIMQRQQAASDTIG
ncbi:MAG: efflux RND transporter periplasmic adaptor subunit [Calditrichia bacterium]